MVVALLVGQLWSAAARVHAQPSEAELAHARERFKEGVALVEQERWAEAADIFQEVAAVKASPVVTYNLALAWSKLGKVFQAVELLRPLARDTSAPDDAKRGASTLLAELEPRLGSLTVRATGDTRDLELWIDGREFTASWLGRSIEVNPGSVEVRAVRGGMQIAKKWAEVSEGSRTAEVTLELGQDDRLGAAPAAAAPVVKAKTVPAPTETAETGYEPVPDQEDDAVELDFSEDRQSGSVFGKWWFWTAVVAVAAGGVTAAVLLTADDTPADPVGGDIGNGVLKSPVTIPMGGM
jgi:hypothetical protein